VRLRRIGVTAALMMGLATGAFAQSEYQAPRLDSMLSNALFSTNGETTIGSAPRVEAMLDNAVAQAAQPTGSDKHQFGVGVRLGGYGFGAGVGVRYFMSGPIGVQAEFIHYGGISFSEIQAAVVYRFKDIKMDFPIVLTPYVGGGVAVARYFGLTDTGGMGLGGVEVFFAQVPQAGVSVQFAFRPSLSGYAYGGANATIGFYWYLG
jgi:hypothetical protein